MKRIYILKSLFLIILGICSNVLYGQTSTFNYTGSMQTYTVPPGATLIAVDATGASGAEGGNPYGFAPGLEGNGARVQTTLAVTPGEVLSIYVGGQGALGTGGWNGGANGGTCDGANEYGGGGGGASDIRFGGTTLTDRIVVAGGGGGGGASGQDDGNGSHTGGDGGDAGQNGSSGNPAQCNAYGGGGGTSTSGGIGGSSAGNGTLGLGGIAQDCGAVNYYGSGGGGGAGYYGGGGGGSASTDCTEGNDPAGAGGGGGSSYSVGTGTTFTSGYNSGNGQVIITVLCSEITITADPGFDVCPGTMVTLTGTSANGGIITWDNGITNGVAFEATTTTTYTAISDNIDDCDAVVTITVEDNDPVITCPDDFIRWNWAGECWGVAEYTAPVGTDDCSDAVTVLTEGLGSGAEFPVGDNVETYTVTDTAGNTATCSFTITIWDEEDPTIDCPDNITVSNDVGECGAVVNYPTPEAADNCGVTSLVMTAGLASGSTFPIGTTTVTWEASDSPGQTAECSFTVTVEDTEAPSITCGDAITADNDPGVCGAVVSYDLPVATDNCPGATVTLIDGIGSGNLFPVGTTTETYVATDASGNEDTCSFTVTIVDAELPIINCESDIEVNLVPGSCEYIVNYLPVTASDNCEGVVVEMIAGLGSGGAFPGGETIEIYVATDAAGNTDTCSFTVTVIDAIDPVISCIDDTIICLGDVINLAPVIDDNCAVDTTYVLTGAITDTGNGAVSSAMLPEGTTTIEYTVTDPAGNTDICSFTVTVKDAYEETITAEICDGESYTMPDGTTETTSGTYTFAYPFGNGCDSTIIVELTVITVNVGVSQDEATLTADAAGAGYQWLDCNDSNAPLSGETGQSFTATESGSYAVEVTESSCVDVSDCITVTLIDGLEDGNIIENILVYPNPVIDNLTVDLGEVYQALHVSILNLEGQVIYEYDETNTQVLNYELHDLISGAYFIRISAEGESTMLRFNKK